MKQLAKTSSAGRRQSILAIVLFSLGAIVTPAIGRAETDRAEIDRAETVLERVERTGVLMVGATDGSLPFSDREDDQWHGYSIEVVKLIQAQLQQQLGRQIELKMVEVNSHNWFTKVADREVDLVCSSTSFTWSRQLNVDFSLGYFVTGTQLLVERDGVLNSTDLRFGVIDGTTNAQAIASRFPIATFVSLNSRKDGLLALQQGRIDALVSDGILLEGLRHAEGNPDRYAVIPARPYDEERYACMVPQGETEWMAIVNTSLLELMEGVVGNLSPHIDIFNAWFGEAGMTPINAQPLLEYFQQMVQSRPVPSLQFSARRREEL